MHIYDSQIKPYTQMPEEVERALVIKAQAGDIEARNELVEQNLRLVMMIARNYTYDTEPVEDLVSNGNIGLIAAVKAYKLDMGTRFASYAVYRIRQAITRYIMKHGSTVRVPVNIHEKLSQYKKAAHKLELKLHRMPTIKEISKEMKLSQKRLGEVLTVLQYKSKPGEWIDDEVATDLTLQHEAEMPYEVDHDTMIDLDKILKAAKLSETEIDLIKQRYIHGLEYNKIKTLKKLTRSGVHFNTRRAMNKLKTVAERMKLREYRKEQAYGKAATGDC
jgi:RNA polymerase sigma factor (sigma-70 family)